MSRRKRPSLKKLRQDQYAQERGQNLRDDKVRRPSQRIAARETPAIPQGDAPPPGWSGRY